ncbi:ets DNA-binding protein pokkuri-like [Macrobrachium nipponense]|uniref:ets DNA-binding protein pokkuri-like n=1 Tax=Macrobrachium nipponense TaxID=159736 RepID=UPI0030C85EB3
MEQDPASADVTVATKGFTLPAHRIVLAAASKFFSSVLQCVPSGQHPVIVVRDANPRHLKFVINFCYNGSVTIPAQDVNHVVKLADDLEICGLRVSSASGGSPLPPTSLPSLQPPFSALRQRLYRPPSPKKFTFSPIPTSSHHSPSHQGPEDLRGEKRHNSSSSYHEVHSRKRFKIAPIPVGKEGEPPHCSSSMSPVPPGSAPPNLPSTSFFGRTHPSPPNSAPPRSSPQNRSPLRHDLHGSTADDESPLNLASPPQLLESGAPLPLTTTLRSNPPSPLEKREPNSPTSMPVPSTPNSLALALTEPLTPSTPITPTTPSLFNGDSSNSNRMGLGCNASGCSTGSRVLLWRFLLDLLHNPHYSPIYIRWLDRPAGIFRIMESDMVAQLWGMARKNSNMNYEKMSRGMRTYYKRGILFHIDGTKLIYKFNTTDPEIQQRMRYYDLTLKSQENNEATNEHANDQHGLSSQIPPSAIPGNLNLSNLQAIPSLPNLPVAVTSSSATSAIDSIYNSHFLRDLPPLSSGLLYEPYITSFLSRASQRELF